MAEEILNHRQRKYTLSSFKPLCMQNYMDKVQTHKTMKVIVVFLEELKEEENRGWLTLAESAFEFWDNEEDAYYDNL